MGLDPKQRDRLVRFLDIAESSAHDGEAIAAFRQAVKLAQTHKLSLARALQVASTALLDTERLAQLEAEAYRRGQVKGVEIGTAAAGDINALKAQARADISHAYEMGFRHGRAGAGGAQAAAAPGRSWRDAALELNALPTGRVYDSAARFIADILAKRWRTLTQKQEGWLRALCDEYGVVPW